MSEGQNNNKDRIAALKEEIARLRKGAEELKVTKEQSKRADLLDAALEKRDALSGLEKELKTGHYFAKADDIFPRDKYELIERSGFKGAADKMTRKEPPNSDDGKGLYESELKAFLKHLDEDGSVADMNSVPPSDVSEEAGSQEENAVPGGGENSKTGSSQSGNSKDRLRRHTSGSQMGGKARGVPPANLKRSIIPDKEGHRGHQLPDALTDCW